MRILFVGNSFTNYNGLNRIFGNIAACFGLNVKSEQLSSDGYFLNQFASIDDVYGRVLDNRLHTNDDYDVLVLQEFSTNSYLNYEDFFNSVSVINDKVQETQKHARIFLYETWGYEVAAVTLGLTPDQMEILINAAYNMTAAQLGLSVSPVGKAFSKAYHEMPDIDLLGPDKRHPSYAGSYLAACVNAAAILGVDVREADFYGSLDEKTAKRLQALAYEVVQQGQSDWILHRKDSYEYKK